MNAQNVRNPCQGFLLWGVEASMIDVAPLWLWRVYVPLDRVRPSVLAHLVHVCVFNVSVFNATIVDFFRVMRAWEQAAGLHRRSASIRPGALA